MKQKSEKLSRNTNKHRKSNPEDESIYDEEIIKLCKAGVNILKRSWTDDLGRPAHRTILVPPQMHHVTGMQADGEVRYEAIKRLIGKGILHHIATTKLGSLLYSFYPPENTQSTAKGMKVRIKVRRREEINESLPSRIKVRIRVKKKNA